MVAGGILGGFALVPGFPTLIFIALGALVGGGGYLALSARDPAGADARQGDAAGGARRRPRPKPAARATARASSRSPSR